MGAEGNAGRRARVSKRYEAWVRTDTLPILEILEHARQTLMRLGHRADDSLPELEPRTPRSREGRDSVEPHRPQKDDGCKTARA